MQKLNSVV